MITPDPATVRAPDLVIVRPGVDDRRAIAADQVLLAVEIASPGSAGIDAVMLRSDISLPTCRARSQST